MTNPISYSVQVEDVPADEERDIARIGEIVQQTIQIHREKTGAVTRDVHAKGIGCARGSLRVREELSGELAQGMFARPGVYGAVVRFSNAAPWLQSDILPDARGVAIQVEQVPGDKLDAAVATQDFLLVNHPCFIVKNVQEFLHLEEARLRACDDPVQLAAALALHSGSPLAWNWQDMITTVRAGLHLPRHPATQTYFSMSAFRYGEYCCKFRLQPAGDVPGSLTESATRLVSDRDALGHWLAETLQAQSLAFDFQVQLRTSEQTMPIEDASVIWPEDESPFRTVARLELPVQEINAAANQECEQRSFNVWHALTAHRPLGGINRARKWAYPISAALRHST